MKKEKNMMKEKRNMKKEKNIMKEMMEVEEMIRVNGVDVKADRLQEMEVMVDMKKEEEGRFRLVGPFS